MSALQLLFTVLSSWLSGEILIKVSDKPDERAIAWFLSTLSHWSHILSLSANERMTENAYSKLVKLHTERVLKWPSRKIAYLSATKWVILAMFCGESQQKKNRYLWSILVFLLILWFNVVQYHYHSEICKIQFSQLFKSVFPSFPRRVFICRMTH